MTSRGDRPPRRVMRIDLNADLGEGIGDDEALLAIVTSANIATGAHAGGADVLARAVAAAARAGVAIGAHPSYRDRAGFGRASHLAVLHGDLSARSHLVADLVAQVLDVAREADRHGVPLAHVKAHGSLYNEAVRDPVAAQVVADAVVGVEHALGYRVAVVTQPGGELAALASRLGMTVLHEGFADRAYLGTGHLLGRSEPGAVLGGVESMVAQALDLARGHVLPVEGPRIAVAVDSLCVHGDSPGAVAAARAIREALRGQGWEVASPGGPVALGEHAPLTEGSLGAAEVQDRARSGRTPAAASDTGGTIADLLAITAFGDRALLVEPPERQLPGTQWVLRMAARARRRWPAATVVPGLASVLVAFERPSDRPDPRGPETRTVLSGHRWAESRPFGVEVDPVDTTDRIDHHHRPPVRLHTLPTRYDGPDLADVAGMLAVPTDEVVRRHREATWTVAAIGFSPGFGYLTTPDPLFAGVVRRPDPRPRVPRGSVALAAGTCAVYPSATPGGWQLIATTPAELFDVHAEHPAVLHVGDQVTFVEVL
jgi:5-oxoprolinase (ATP-hydrolysing) subunit A